MAPAVLPAMATLKLICSRRAVAASAYVNTNWRFTQTLQRRQQLQLQQQLCRRLSAAATATAAAAQTATTRAMPKSHANVFGKLNHYYANYACCNCLLSMRFDLYAYPWLPSSRMVTQFS